MSEIRRLAEQAKKYESLSVTLPTDDVLSMLQKLDAVVAENAALKDGIAKCTAAVEHWNSWADTEDKISLHIEAPATDAILNAVRAEGVELFANELRRQQNESVTQSEFHHTSLGRSAAKAEAFAAQLRADAAKGGSDD